MSLRLGPRRRANVPTGLGPRWEPGAEFTRHLRRRPSGLKGREAAKAGPAEGRLGGPRMALPRHEAAVWQLPAEGLEGRCNTCVRGGESEWRPSQGHRPSQQRARIGPSAGRWTRPPLPRGGLCPPGPVPKAPKGLLGLRGGVWGGAPAGVLRGRSPLSPAEGAAGGPLGCLAEPNPWVCDAGRLRRRRFCRERVPTALNAPSGHLRGRSPSHLGKGPSAYQA